MAERKLGELFHKFDFSFVPEILSEATVDHILMNRENRMIKADIYLPCRVARGTLENLSEQIKTVYNLSSLELTPHFPKLSLDTEAWPQIVDMLKNANCASNGFFKDSTIEIVEDKIFVSLKYGGLSIMQKFGVDKDLKKIIHDISGENLEIEYIGITEVDAEHNEINNLEIPEIPLPEAPPEKQLQAAPKTAPQRKKFEPAKIDPSLLFADKDLPVSMKDSELLKGRKMPQLNITQLSKINRDSGRVTVAGEVFSMDSRQLRNRDAVRVTLYLTDNTGSTIVKFIEDLDRFEEYSKQISVGNCIICSGEIMYDKYEEDIVLSATTIATAKRKVRNDTANTKRVELHLHSNMSSMDATNDIEDFVKRAAYWGHPAIALTDHGNLQAYPKAQQAAQKHGIKMIFGVEGYLMDDLLQDNTLDPSFDYKKGKSTHVVILVKNRVGLRNLYELVTKAHLDHFYKRPIILKSELASLREGLLVGSACEAGELFRAILDKKSEAEIERLVTFYDYLEIQPLGNNEFLVRNGVASGVEELQDYNRKIIDLGKKYNKMVCATCDAHFLEEKDEVFRRVLMAGKGFSDADQQPPLYFRSTNEMLNEFSYLDTATAEEVVILNPNKIAEMCEEIEPIPSGMYPPSLEGAEEDLERISMENAYRLYGNPLPDLVKARLEKELKSIIGNGFSVMYMIAQKLVKKSNDDGYFVGSRGSVGSSFVATMIGVSEVNPLPPHYLCPNCQYSEFFLEGEYGSGFDMDSKPCPHCGTLMKCDGHNIPFETFLGFKGDKVPDIDLNFSGVYQATAHQYVEELFGTGFVFKAGTIGTMADKTAFGFVKKYLEERGIILNKAEEARLVNGCVGTKRTTGQHPGGMVVIPKDRSVYDFTPVQHPADDVNSDILTTHFDFHSLHDTILKLDILGHDVPTMLRMLEDLTGVPFDTIPMNDKAVYSLLQSPKALGVTAADIDCETGTFALPEMGTSFVRGMLLQAKPKNFSDLIQIAGLSHGTDVWLGNAEELIAQGVCTISDVIGTRDSIMVYLIQKGLEPTDAFKIMEIVRKGKSKALLTEEMLQKMRDCNVPEWYIDSCMKIKYMFPKAHAAAYVMGAIRLGWYKINYKKEFYATHLSTRPDGFDALEVSRGRDYLKNIVKDIEAMGKQAKQKEAEKMTTYQIVLEAMARGIEFLPVDINKSDAFKFLVEGDNIRMPFSVFNGVGESAAAAIAATRDSGDYISQEDFKIKAGISATVLELMNRENVFGSLPQTAQLSFF